MTDGGTGSGTEGRTDGRTDGAAEAAAAGRVGAGVEDRQGETGRASNAGGRRPGTARGAVAQTVAPPWHGGVNVGLLFAAAAWVITYTLVPLPGQRSLGDVNYVGAVALFVTAIVLTRVLRVAAMRRFRAERDARATAAATQDSRNTQDAPAAQDDPSST